MDRVEKTFTKHFYNSNRNKAMRILRPKTKRERHRVTFSMGKHHHIHIDSILGAKEDKFLFTFLLSPDTVDTFSGFFAGCTTALVLALILIIRTRNIFDNSETTKYMETLFPLHR